MDRDDLPEDAVLVCGACGRTAQHPTGFSDEWHEDDAVLNDPDKEVGDPVTFYEEHDGEVHDQALEMQQARSEGRWGDHPDV